MRSLTADAVVAGFDRRREPVLHIAEQAHAVAHACRDMAERFSAGGRLLVFGTGAGATDSEHVAVEFVHPVIVGKRALPAVSLASDVATVTGVGQRSGLDEVFAHQVRVLGRPEDIALGIAGSSSAGVIQGLRAARRMGLLTVALLG
jgi:D-sedoheptulose 7-phosphate isomerase